MQPIVLQGNLLCCNITYYDLTHNDVIVLEMIRYGTTQHYRMRHDVYRNGVAGAKSAPVRRVASFSGRAWSLGGRVR